MKRLSTKRFNGLAAMIGLTLIAPLTLHAAKPQTAATPAAPPKEPPPATATAKQEAIDSLDARIQNLQSTRDCINKAQTHQAVQACRSGAKQK